MRYLSACSGIEAFSVAWQPLSWLPAMFAEIDPLRCRLLRSRYRASRPIVMPRPHDAPDIKEAKRRAAALRKVVALLADGDIINAGDFSLENSSTTAVLQEQSITWSNELPASTGTAGPLQRGGEGGQVDRVMAPQMAVPVMRWIRQRIVQVDAILRDGHGVRREP